MANYGMLQDKTERIWLWSQFWVNASRYWSDLSFLWTPVKKQKTKQRNWTTWYGAPILYTVKLGGAGRRGRGGVGAIWTGLNCSHLSRNFVFYCIAAQPFQTVFIFPSLFSPFFIMDFVITHHPIARSRWSRWHDFSLYWAARRLLLSLFPDINVANI